MTSKWIDDVQTILWKDWSDDEGVPWTEICEKLEIIDNLLRQSMAGTDNETLSDAIRREINVR